ncbi:hypothetical protein L0128_07940 [candidate division KSB1 bacterium]|nr:hypothetical protein [candidate division KSB1 bacterium]
MIVKLKKKTSQYPDLTPQQSYIVIGIEGNDYRILNDDGRPYLYPFNLFEIEDAAEPEDWISETGEEGERYAYPPALNAPGFFEDFFDGDKNAVSRFWRAINQRLALAS